MNVEKKLPSGVVLHAGVPLDPNMEFPISPPSEIGVLRTAQSTIGVKNINSIPFRISISAFCMLMLGLPIFAIAYVNLENRHPNALMISFWAGLVPASLIGIKAWFGTGAKKVVTFVGESGLVRYELKQVELAPTKTELLLFSQTEDLRTHLLENYSNAIYTNTTYGFTWYDQTGAKIFSQDGVFRGNSEGLPKKIIDPYFFALSAQQAYNEFVTERMAKEFEKNGVVEFSIHGFKKQDSVRVGDGFLEFDFKGQVDRVEADDIKRIKIEEGVFYIDTKDAKFFGRQGKFRFVYGKLSNAQLFLYALNQLAGFTVE